MARLRPQAEADTALPGSLEAIKRRLERIESRSRERPTAEVTTARRLADHQRAVFEERLRRRYGADLEVRFRVEPAILGGVIVRVGDRLVDDSLATRLAQLRDALLGARVRAYGRSPYEDQPGAKPETTA